MTTVERLTNQEIIDRVSHHFVSKFDWINGYKTFGDNDRLVEFHYDCIGQGAILEDEIHEFIGELDPQRTFATRIIPSDKCLTLKLI